MKCHPERSEGPVCGGWRRRRANLPHRFLAALGMTILLAGCAATAPEHLGPSTSPSPSTPGVPPASAMPPPVPERATPPIDTPLPLDRAIDIALTNNPNTRAAWLEARANEATLGIARSAYLPEVDLNASINRTQHATTYGPSLALTYLLFDFGGRASNVEQARQALIASDFAHNQVLQDVVLRTEQAYYGVLDAKALLEAQAATVKERQASVDAAQARHCHVCGRQPRACARVGGTRQRAVPAERL